MQSTAAMQSIIIGARVGSSRNGRPGVLVPEPAVVRNYHHRRRHNHHLTQGEEDKRLPSALPGRSIFFCLFVLI